MSVNPYSVATSDSPEMKVLVCGRTENLKNIIPLLLRGKSIALFGEKRIGKTLTLFLVRDIINKSINDYKDSLFDKDLLQSLKASDSEIIRALQFPADCKYFNLQSFSPRSLEDILAKFHTYFPQPKKVKKETLYELFGRVSYSLQGRLVILIDEMEEVLDPEFKDRDTLFEQLNAVTQNISNISFVFAGAEHWVKTLNLNVSVLKNCVHHFLSNPESLPLRKYLLDIPLTEHIPSESKRTQVTAQIMEQSGGRPLYCQAMAYEIALGKSFDSALNEVRTSTQYQIEHFFKDPPEPGAKILCLLAHKPKLSDKQISKALGISRQAVFSALNDLLALGKIIKLSPGWTLPSRGSKSTYAVNGKLLESWGASNLAIPETKTYWPNRLRWAATVTLLFVAFSSYIYTHPLGAEFKPKNDVIEETIVISMPRTVERGERGVASLYIISGEQGVAHTKVFPLDGSGRLLSTEGNSHWEFAALVSGQRSEMKDTKYFISSDTRDSEAVFRLRAQVGEKMSEALEFSVPMRSIPLKEFWLYISGFAAALAAFTKWDLISETWNLVRGKKQ